MMVCDSFQTGPLTMVSFLDILVKSFSSRPMTSVSLMQKRRYRVVLDLEILDDSHPEDFNWEKMIDIGPGECVNLVRVEEEEDNLW
jgi:hypothetical protein